MVVLIKSGEYLPDQNVEIITPQQMNDFLRDYHLLKKDNRKRREYYEMARRKQRPRDESLRHTEKQELDLWRAYWDKLAVYDGKLNDLNVLSMEAPFKAIQPLGPRSSPLQINIAGDMTRFPDIQITLNDARHHLEKSLERKVLGITSASVIQYNTGVGYAGCAFIRGE